MFPGGSTTATAMSGIFFYLSHNSEAYARLTTEIRTIFSSGHDIQQGKQLTSCKYLRAVIDETMRMSPSTLAIAWRQQDHASVAAGEAFIVDGHVIPPGTQVGVSNYALQHDSSYFPEPYRFNPERWLTQTDDSQRNPGQNDVRPAVRHAFAPFSIGDRSCAGKSMAYLEMSLAIAKTVWYFDFQQAPNESDRLAKRSMWSHEGREREDEFQLYDGVVVGHDGPNITFTARGEYWKELNAASELIV
jgi:cytochrome P450